MRPELLKIAQDMTARARARPGERRWIPNDELRELLAEVSRHELE